MSEFRVRTEQEVGIVGARPIPLPHLLITATSSGGAQTFATVRSGVVLRIKQLAVANVTGTAATLSLNTIPSGGSIGDSNAEAKAVSIPANSLADITDFVGGMYAGGTTFKVYSGTGSALVIHGWAEEIL
jgi:hypothetical protein